MVSIRKRGNRYQAQVRLSGGRASSATFDSRQEAQAWIREAAYTLSQLPVNIDDRTTLADITKRFMREALPLRRSAKIEALRLGALLRHPLANKPLSSITVVDACEYRDYRLERVKWNTFIRELGLIRTVVETAINDWGILVPNPFANIRMKKEPDQRQRRLTGEELNHLMTADCGNHYTKPTMILALETAMRLGELLSLTWTNVDLERGFAELKHTKNGYGRVVPLTGKAIEAINQLPKTHIRIIPNKNDTLKQSWRRLVSRAGIEDLRFHDLRHEAISRLLEKGLTIPEAASVSGHRTTSMLARYAHPDQLKVRQKMMENG